MSEDFTKLTKAQLVERLQSSSPTGDAGFPVRALLAVGAVLSKAETGLVLKDPPGRIAQDKGDLYVCEPGESPGTVRVRIERDQTAYRTAYEAFDIADHRQARAERDLTAAKKARAQAAMVKHKEHEAQYAAKASLHESEVASAREAFAKAAEDCPQAYFDVLTARAAREADQAAEQESLAAKKSSQADDLEGRGKVGTESQDDQMAAVAAGCRQAAEEAAVKAAGFRKKESALLSLRPDCGGAKDLIEELTVRLVAVPV